MRRLIPRVAIAGLFAIAATAASAQAPSAPAPKMVVKVGVPGRADQYNFEIALRRGYFAELGLEVETVAANSAQEYVSAIASNQIQVASGSPNAGLFNALSRGIDIRMVADWAHLGDGAGKDSVAIVVRAELFDTGAVTTIADLKGRTLAAGPGPAMYPDVLNQKMYALAKLAPADVTVVYLAFADSLAAMSGKKVDAAFMVEPLITQADTKNIARVLVRAGAVDPGAELALLMYSAAFAANKDAATRFMVGYLKGARDYYDAFYMNTDRDAVIQLLTQYLPVKDPRLWQAATPGHTDLNGRINVADLKRQAAFFQQQGTLTGALPDLDRYVTAEFAEAATKIIGQR
jgi:NitT/TauT family transport system substrate-binding protein